MKRLIAYNFSFENMFFNFLKDKDTTKLLSEIDRIENCARKAGNKHLMIRFGERDTVLYTINELKKDVMLPENHSNRILLLEKMDFVTCDIDPEKNIVVY